MFVLLGTRYLVLGRTQLPTYCSRMVRFLVRVLRNNIYGMDLDFRIQRVCTTHPDPAATALYPVCCHTCYHIIINTETGGVLTILSLCPFAFLLRAESGVQYPAFLKRTSKIVLFWRTVITWKRKETFFK